MSSSVEAGGRAPWADMVLPEWSMDQIKQAIWEAGCVGEDLTRLNEDCRMIAECCSDEAWVRMIHRVALDAAVTIVKLQAMHDVRIAKRGE